MKKSMPLPIDGLNQTVFQVFSPTMSDEDEESWDGPGAFPSSNSRPSSNKSDNHIFADEPFEGEYYSLDTVKEESKDSKEAVTGTANSPDGDEFVAVSVASSDTPAINNTAEAALKKVHTQHLGIQQNLSMNSGNGLYPYNIYQSLSKEKKPREDASNDEKKNKMGSTSSRKAERDREESSMPPQITPMSIEDEESSSIFTDQQSHLFTDQEEANIIEGASSQPPYSVMSTHSRRQGKRLVRHTLATSQQVTANPANMLKNLFIGIEEERQMHKLAAQNLKAVHNWLMFLPAILFAFLSGVVALVFEADLNVDESVRVYSSIFVGVTALFSVFWQALSKQLDLGTRGVLHSSTAAALKRISEDILLTLSSTEAIPAEYVALTSEKFSQALDSCPSILPYKMETAFSLVSDRMVLIVRPRLGQSPRKHVHKLDFMRLYATAYGELTAEIIDYWAWPFAYPTPRNASDAALRNFKAIITEGRETNKKKGCLRICFPCLGNKEVERSLFDILPAASVSSPRADPYQIRSHMLGTEI